VHPGVESRFTPAGAKSERPLVVAVGRLAPVKRFEALVDAQAATLYQAALRVPGRDNLIWPREGGLKWPHL